MNNFTFATVGDNCIDRFQPPVGVSVVGGNAVNVAVQLCRLGHPCAYFGAVAPDEDGRRTIAALQANGVPVEHVQRLPGVTAYTNITVDDCGDRIIGYEEFGVCRLYQPTDAEVALLCTMRHVHFGWMNGSKALIAKLRSAGVSVSKDTSVNPGATGLSVAFASSQGGADQALAAAQSLLTDGADVAVITMGARGSLATDGRVVAQTGVAAVTVVDTTGAGDTFIAGFMARRIGGGSLQQSLEAGRDKAAETCTYLGGFPQTPLAWPAP